MQDQPGAVQLWLAWGTEYPGFREVGSSVDTGPWPARFQQEPSGRRDREDEGWVDARAVSAKRLGPHGIQDLGHQARQLHKARGLRRYHRGRCRRGR